MRNLKKFLALVLALMMTFSLMVTVNAAKTPADFEDVSIEDTSYAEAINVLSALGIFNGYDIDGTTIFNPTGYIKRSEVAAILYRVAANDADDSQVGIYKDYDQFTDVPSDAWYAGAVNYCANAELVVGVNDEQTLYSPHSNVTGYQVLAMVLRMLGYDANNEFRGTGWQIRTASYARQVGLTDNIKEGTLGQYATREMVAEIMFQALQADLVNYNQLRNYYPRTVLIADDAAGTNREAYADALADGRLTLPLNADLMYVNYGIVGKSPTLTFDKFGRPSEAWVKDASGETTTCSDHAGGTHGNAEKYIPNATIEAAAQQYITVVMTPVAKYNNAVTECQVSKDLGDDETQDWKNIAEVLNGNAEATLDNLTTLGVTQTMDYNGGGVDHKDNTKFDALHTSDKWIGATGRTTEIYDVSDYNIEDKNAAAQNYVIVYVDTFLGEVVSVTEAVKDPNGHVIKPAVITAKVGTDEKKVEVSGSYEVGQLILLQTANYGETNNPIKDITAITTGEKVPVTPADVHIVDADAFPADGENCVVKAKAETKRVTIKGTKGVADDKTGIETTDGDVIWASNTFLANKTAANKTVLPEWYDVDVAARGITNSMIGRTYDLVLDQNGYIVGMKEVLTIDSTVGVITGYDQHRVGTGKYLSAVEAYMSDGTTQTFNVVDMTAAEVTKIGTATAFDTNAFKFFTSGAAADDAWDAGSNSLYGGTTAKLGIGSLVMFKQCTVDGVDAWYFADRSAAGAGKKLTDKDGDAVTDNNVEGYELQAAADFVATGNAKCLDTSLTNSDADIAKQLDDKSVVFVAEPEYAYNTGGANEGNNTLKYNVYEGFKKMPTITAAAVGGTDSANNNILYQQLVNNPEYVLIYPQTASAEYIIRNQSTIMVDESYLVLSRGTTYAGYSEYNVLKNGKIDVLQVSNSNDTLNDTIETAMANGDLLTVTGRNSAGYVISAATVKDLANATTPSQVAIANCGGVKVDDTTDKYTTKVPGAATVAFSENDGVINFKDGSGTPANIALTLADDCTIQLINLGTGTVKDISVGVAKVYINSEGNRDPKVYCDFTFELDQYGYVCSLYVIEK